MCRSVGVGPDDAARGGTFRDRGPQAQDTGLIGVDFFEIVDRVAIVKTPDAVHQLAVVLQWRWLAACKNHTNVLVRSFGCCFLNGVRKKKKCRFITESYRSSRKVSNEKSLEEI